MDERKVVIWSIIGIIVFGTVIAVLAMKMMTGVNRDVETGDGELVFVSKTEYIAGDEGQVIVELRNLSNSVPNMTCQASVYYPNKQPFILNQNMTPGIPRVDLSTMRNSSVGLQICAPLDARLTDLANGNNATSVGSPTSSATGGLFDGYYVLDGVNDRITFPAGLNPSSSFAVMYDIKTNKSGYHVGNLNASFGPTIGWALGYTGNTWITRFGIGNGFDFVASSGVAPNVTDNSWHRIVASWDSTTNYIVIYQDGNQVANFSVGAIPGWASINCVSGVGCNPTGIGFGRNDTTWVQTNGVSSFMLLNRVITAQEVTNLWNQGYGSTCENITAGVVSGPAIGTQWINFTIPSTEGTYEYQASCVVTARNRTYTRSNSFHVSSQFRRLTEDLSTLVTIVDEGMGTQQYPNTVTERWKIRGHLLNITGASCWVENGDAGMSAAVSQTLWLPSTWPGCISYFTTNIGGQGFIYANGGYPINVGLDPPINANTSFTTMNPDVNMYVSRLIVSGGAGGSISQAVFNLKIVDMANGEMIFNQNGSAQSAGFQYFMQSWAYGAQYPSALTFKRAHTYNWTWTWLTCPGSCGYALRSVSTYDNMSGSNIYGLDVTSGNGNGTIPWIALYGTAGYGPLVNVTIDAASESLTASWDPILRYSVFNGQYFSDATYNLGDGYPVCNFTLVHTGPINMTNTTYTFKTEHSYATVCNVTYAINGTYYLKRLQSEAFITNAMKPINIRITSD